METTPTSADRAGIASTRLCKLKLKLSRAPTTPRVLQSTEGHGESEEGHKEERLRVYNSLSERRWQNQSNGDYKPGRAEEAREGSAGRVQ